MRVGLDSVPSQLVRGEAPGSGVSGRKGEVAPAGVAHWAEAADETRQARVRWRPFLAWTEVGFPLVGVAATNPGAMDSGWAEEAFDLGVAG